MTVTIPQFFGIILAVLCLYYSYLQYKRKLFELADFILWLSVWGGLLFLSIISGFIPLMKVIYIYSIFDLVIVLCITTLFIMFFIGYIKFKSYQRKVRDLVKRVAFIEAELKKKMRDADG